MRGGGRSAYLAGSMGSGSKGSQGSAGEREGDRPAPPRSPLGAAWILASLLAVGAVALRSQLGPSPSVPSASVIALGLGIAVGLSPALRRRFGAAAKTVSKAVIPAAIVLIGFGLDLGPLLASGSLLGGLLVVLGCMAVAFVGAWAGGRVMGLDARAAMLLGAGTAVCGNSAVMAVAPTVDADDDDLGLCIGVINFLGIVMVFALPPLARALGLGTDEGGALAGLTVHALPQAIATGESMGGEALATTYKLVRVAMLVPVALLMAFAIRRARGRAAEASPGRAIPTFMILFVLAAVARAAGWVDAEVSPGWGEARPLWAWAKDGGKLALGIALAAIGMGLDLGKLVRVGPRVLAAGTIAVAAMVAAAVPLVRLLF